MANIQDTSCGKMYQEHLVQTKAKTSKPFLNQSQLSAKRKYLFLNLKNGEMPERLWEMVTPLHGELLMHNTLEFPKDVKESTLSQILIANVPEKYYLSQKACLGILNRASKRGKELPLMLKIALENQAKVM